MCLIKIAVYLLFCKHVWYLCFDTTIITGLNQDIKILLLYKTVLKIQLYIMDNAFEILSKKTKY